MTLPGPRPPLDGDDLAAYIAARGVGDCCPWCGHIMRPGRIQVAYRIPPSHGGQWRASNLMAVCVDCSQTRAATP